MGNRKIHFIINPRSSGGYTGQNWTQLETEIRSSIGDFTYEFTTARGAAMDMAAKAVQSKIDILVVVGGDGTISETVNGYLTPEKVSKKPSIVIVNRGTGGDFCRTLGIPADLHISLEQIKNGRDIDVDAGRIKYIDHSGEPATRYFINVAGCGMAGEVVQAINKSSKKFGGFTYFLISSQKLFTYKNKKVRLTINDQPAEVRKIVTVAVCNGQFFGGGMQISPSSELGDGQFNVVTIGNWSKLQSLWYSKNLYNGTINQAKGVHSQKATRVLIEPVDKNEQVMIDCDGEDVGTSPAEFSILPGAVRFRI